jgi:uncharacterized membrane protein
MAKMTRLIKGRQVSTDPEHHASFEQEEIYDDFVLPSADELKKLSEMEPGILPWIMGQAELEQANRFSFINQQLDLSKIELQSAYRTDVLTIIVAFLTIITGMAASFYLLNQGSSIAGSLFGGVTMIIATRSFLNFKRQSA